MADTQREPAQTRASVPLVRERGPEDPAEQPPGPTPIEFTGQTSEYFGIWVTNTLLSIVTLGIYSAWAKVRQSRYFLGHTIILGDGLEYHATGMMILKGRLIAFAVIAGYVGIGSVSPIAQLVVTIALIPVYPWVINRTLKFRARMTSWRNIRFDWHGGYGGMAKVYLLWPLIALLTLGALLPMAARVSREYLANNYALGRERFGATTPLRPYYGAFLWTIVFGAALLAVVAGLVVAVFFLLRSDVGDLPLSPHIISLFPSIIIIIMLFLFSMIRIYFQILTRNIIVTALTLGHAAGFRADLSPLRYQWILLSNLFVTVATAFLMYPWARIRAYRYQAERLTVEPLVAVAAFLDTEARAGGAFGEEFGEMEGIGIDI